MTLLPASSAGADGLPVGGVDVGSKGVSDGGGSRYVTIAARDGTVIARTSTSDGTIDAWFQSRGSFTVPAVAYDGTPSGLSADGGTLVLVKPRVGYPRRQTSFFVVDTGDRLTPAGPITLKGDFSFDAISPDGETMYLIRYLSPRDQTRYEVRAYDLVERRLLPGAIVDPSKPDERMAGIPMTRATSPEGRWAYTLYDGAGHEPFIHALDTERGEAHCIDLPQLEGRKDIGLMGLGVDRSTGAITVLSRPADHPRSRPVLRVDPASFAVTGASVAPAEPSAAGLPAWWLIAASTAGLLVAILLAGGLPRRRRHEEDLANPLRALDEDPEPKELASSRRH